MQPLFSVLFMLFASARTTTAFTPRTKLQTSLLRTPAAMAAFSAQPKAAAVEKKKRKKMGPPQPPIFSIPEEKRLFTTPNQSTGECLLLHDVQCLSLYQFVDVADPESMAERLTAALSSGLASSSSSSSSTTSPATDSPVLAPRPYEDFVGTVYLAREGINAQFAVRSGYPMAVFESALREAAGGLLDGLDEFNMGDALAAGSSTPFKRFRVVARPQILTDGLLLEGDGSTAAACAANAPLSSAFDWTDAGPELSPAEWHQHLLANGNDDAGASSGDAATAATAAAAAPPVLLDCRNRYESDVGTFRGAVPLGTDTFAESWDALDKTVEELPKDAPVYTFCTGGIRCVKVNAYLKQRHGRTVYRLQHGIIGYEKWLNNNSNSSDFDSNELTAASTTQSLFSGTNFIFDERNQPSSGETAPATHAATNNEEAAAQ